MQALIGLIYKINDNNFNLNNFRHLNKVDEFEQMRLKFIFFVALFLVEMKGDSSVPMTEYHESLIQLTPRFQAKYEHAPRYQNKKHHNLLVEQKPKKTFCLIQRSLGLPQKTFLAKHSCNEQRHSKLSTRFPQNVDRITQTLGAFFSVNPLFFHWSKEKEMEMGGNSARVSWYERLLLIGPKHLFHRLLMKERKL